MEIDPSFLMRSCCCFVEWLTTYSNLVENDRLLQSDDKDVASSI